MKIREIIILGITSAAAIGIIVYVSQKVKTSRMLDQIADQGYETAGDILFPLRGRRERKWPRNYNNLSGWDSDLFY